MKLTPEQLKKIIEEELSHSIGETHRAAAAFDQQAIQQLAAEFKQLLATSQAVKDIQPPREGSIVQALQIAMGGALWQESKKENK